MKRSEMIQLIADELVSIVRSQSPQHSHEFRIAANQILTAIEDADMVPPAYMSVLGIDRYEINNWEPENE